VVHANPHHDAAEFVLKADLNLWWECPRCCASIHNNQMIGFEGSALCGNCFKEFTDNFILIVGSEYGKDSTT